MFMCLQLNLNMKLKIQAVYYPRVSSGWLGELSTNRKSFVFWWF